MILFKLKKDDKVVGYLKIGNGLVYLNPINRPGYWCVYDGPLCKGLFDAAHLFVTTDKNGDKIFAFDRCQALYETGGVIEGEVVVDGTNKAGMPVAPYIEDREGEQRYLTECRGIKLIEEQE